MRSAVLMGIMMLATTTDVAEGQEKAKDYKELDKEALKAFQEGKYEEAAKTWRYIYRDYPRAEFRNLPDNDPRSIAWNTAYYSSYAREGLAKKQALLASEDPTKQASADKVYADAIADVKERMGRDNIPKAVQDKLIKDTTDPLLAALKKNEKK